MVKTYKICSFEKSQNHRCQLKDTKTELLLLRENYIHQAFYHLQMEWVKRQLPGNMLADIGGNVMGYINKSLYMDNFSSSFVYSAHHGKLVSKENSPLLSCIVRYENLLWTANAGCGPTVLGTLL